jgi:serine/threonine-protein kinase RsbW
MPVNEIVAGLETEAELIRLPQVIHVAAADAFDFTFKQISDSEHCLIAHSFEGGTYNDANQVVWLVAEIDSKLECDGQQSRMWVDRLQELGDKCSFGRIQIWLISREGFTNEAGRLLENRDVFYSSRQQVELLSSRLNESSASPSIPSNEVTMVLPMTEDSELIAANTAEQIARRLNFRPEAINQIKTAVVEACINASEHSFSPDRKIYQRFLVEDDKLVVIISSRGVIVPANPDKVNTRQGSEPGSDASAEERRGWGLKLIRTLMDEVEFESVDEGTSLRMTKYLRNGTS